MIYSALNYKICLFIHSGKNKEKEKLLFGMLYLREKKGKKGTHLI